MCEEGGAGMDLKGLWSKYKSVILYVFFGAVTTAVNIVTYFLCYEVFGMANLAANALAWVLAVAVAYLTNKLWVFESKSFAPAVLLPELWKFVSCRLATGALDMLIMWVGVDVLKGPATPFKIIANVLVMVLNYLFSKLLIFRKKG